MKKIISYIGICVVMIGTLIPTHTVWGQGLPAGPISTGTSVLNSNGQTTNTPPPAIQAINQNAAERTAQSRPPQECIPIVNFSLKTCLNNIVGFIGYVLMDVLSLFLQLAGVLLNQVLRITIIDMAENLKTMTGINVGWKVIRDLMNIAFIFLLVWEGIKMILGSGSAGAKKLITGIIISSVLINFSLFFTKVLIDTSNIVTIGFYKAILGNVDANASVGLSNPIMRSLGLTSFYGTGVIDKFNAQAGNDGTKIIILSLGASIIFLIAAFCFLAVSIMFIVRYVTLLLLLITSPIAYMGNALPSMEGYSKQWWSALNSQLLFAPIYMIMTWVVLTLLSSPNFVTIGGGSQQFANLFLGTADGRAGTDSISLLLNFAVVISLLIATLTVAKSTSSKGSSLIANATAWGTAAAGGVLMGGTARLGRQTIGRAGNSISNSEWLKDQASKGGFVGRTFAKTSLNLGTKAATGTFDARSTKVVGTVNKQLGIDLGKVDAKKSNFRAIQSAREKEAEEKAKTFKSSDAAVAKANIELTSKKFIDSEKERRENYLQSNEFRTKENGWNTKISEENKKIAIAKTEKNEAVKEVVKAETLVQSQEAKIKGLLQKITNAKNDTDRDLATKELEAVKTEKITFDERLRNAQAVVKEKDKVISNIESNISNIRNTISKEKDTWISPEQAKLIAIKGGQSGKDEQGKERQEVKSAFAERVDALANREEGRSALWRWPANVLGGSLNTLGITSMPKTKSDREAIARKIRGVAKEKKKTEKSELDKKIEETRKNFKNEKDPVKKTQLEEELDGLLEKKEKGEE